MVSPDIVKILSDYIATLDRTVSFDSVAVNPDGGYKITSCNTLWLSNCDEVTIDGNVYDVEQVIQDESFVVVPEDGSSNPSSSESMELNAPYFIHGTIRKANAEFHAEDSGVKYPMIYLFEIYNENHKSDKTDPVGYSANVRLFFMNSTQSQSYTTEDHYTEVVRPMRALMEVFLKDIVSGFSRVFEEQDSDWDTVPWVDFGKFQDAKGNTKHLFSDQISGYELKINLEVLRSYLDSVCCSKSNCNCNV